MYGMCLSGMAAKEGKEFDMIIFGASGLTGRYVVEELSLSVAESPGIKWAVAGRDAKRLKNALTSVQELLPPEIDIRSTPVVQADVQDPSSLYEMCKRTKLLLNCVGPFNAYGGEMVVSTCIECRTHCIDISAELKYLDRVLLNHFESARNAGVYVVEACGFGSLPADYGISLLMKKFAGGLNSVEYFVEILEGPQGRSTGYGTFLSGLHTIMDYFKYSKFDKEVEAKVFKKKPVKSKFPMNELIRKLLVIYSFNEKAVLLKYVGPDVRNIKRSQMFRSSYLNKEMLIETKGYLKPKSIIAALPYIYVALLSVLMCPFAGGRYLMEKYPSFFTAGLFTTTGPSRKQVLEGGTRITFSAKGWRNEVVDSIKQPSRPDKKLKMIITAPEPAYAFTAICMVQAGLTVLLEQNKIPLEGGVYTPGVAFEDTSLRERLERRGVTFTFVEID